MTPNESDRSSQSPEVNARENVSGRPSAAPAADPPGAGSARPAKAEAPPAPVAAGAKPATAPMGTAPPPGPRPSRISDRDVLAHMRTEFDGLRRTIEQLKLRAAAGDADLLAGLEQHHAALETDLRSLEGRPSVDRDARRESWEKAAKEASVKLRRGASELGGGLGRAWREMRSAAGRAWGEMRSPPPDTHQPPSPPPQAPRGP